MMKVEVFFIDYIWKLGFTHIQQRAALRSVIDYFVMLRDIIRVGTKLRVIRGCAFIFSLLKIENWLTLDQQPGSNKDQNYIFDFKKKKNESNWTRMIL